MKRADRKDSNDDNSLKNPRSRQTEPLSWHEWKQKYLLELSKTTELKNDLQQEKLSSNGLKIKSEHYHQLYFDEKLKAQQFQNTIEQQVINLSELQIKYQQSESQLVKYSNLIPIFREQRDEAKSQLLEIQNALAISERTIDDSMILIRDWKSKSEQNYQLFCQEKDKYHKVQVEYEKQVLKNSEIQIKYQESDSQRLKYLSLYNEAQLSLKQARRSNAGIKGWETRRKKENEKLKQEISDMVIVLRESIERKDEAVGNLYDLASRIDKIQNLVDSVDEETGLPSINLLQKFKRIWVAIQEILSE